MGWMNAEKMEKGVRKEKRGKKKEMKEEEIERERCALGELEGEGGI